MNIIHKFKDFIDQQYGKPQGILGVYIGEKMGKQHRPETEWTIDLLSPHQEDHILELGCGAGYAIKLINEKFNVNVIAGLDISKTVIQSARIRNRKEIASGKVRLIQGNVKHLPIDDNSFSKVFSIQSIYFWDDISETIAEIYRVMKPGGTILLTLSDGESDKKWEGISNMINHDLIPIMDRCGFIDIEKIKGPVSRKYHTLTIKASLSH